MHALKVLTLGALLAAASTAAVAFQEQRQGTGAPAAREQTAPPALRDPAAAFTLPGTNGSKQPGTEIRIPGLGSLGVLPKMDFGLELLYGATEHKGTDDSRAVAPGTDDLQIKGTIRRRF